MGSAFKYFTPEGVEKLRNLSQKLPTFSDDIKKATVDFEKTVAQNRDGLGIKADEISDAVANVKEALYFVDGDMKNLQTRLNATADYIQEYLDIHYDY